MTASESADRRRADDRRQRPTPMLSRFWLRGRRRGARRTCEAQGIYVDRYTRTEWALCAAILALSLADLALTWRHLARGGEEANPLLDWVLATAGGWAFSLTKVALTTVPLLWLLLHVRFRRVRPALFGLLLAYALVLAWHAVVVLDGASA
ncbi:MAG: hypothetical protein IPM29_18280 [Planctomycetes bacterium]|nr:hypothetical protein [Planctomycetota bacterium]